MEDIYSNNGEFPAFRPGLTPEEHTNNLIALAEYEAERRIRSGQASDGLLIHYLKAGSAKERAEVRLVEAQAKLADAKVRTLERAAENETGYSEVIAALKEYSGINNV